MTARVSDIKRFAVHDGPGIRTTLFLQGCPLRCVWCHNPESIPFGPTLSYHAHLCTGCGRCVSVCPNGAHRMDASGHRVLRMLCSACGVCDSVCPHSALKTYGRSMTSDEAEAVLLEDRAFYEASGGGITLSGGECLCQPAFCAALLQRMQANGVHTAVDTCGFVPWSSFEAVIPHTDLFLYDLKHISPQGHRRCTGQENTLILQNLSALLQRACPIEIRIPFAPGYNDDAIEGIGAFLRAHDKGSLRSVKLLPLHAFAGSKYEAVGLADPYPQLTVPNTAAVTQAANCLASFGLQVVMDP